MFYNPNIPLEQALDMFEDAHIRYEIIEDYYHALGELAIEPVVVEELPEVPNAIL